VPDLLLKFVHHHGEVLHLPIVLLRIFLVLPVLGVVVSPLVFFFCFTLLFLLLILEPLSAERNLAEPVA